MAAALSPRRRVHELLAAAALAIAASLLMTWPLARHASDHVLRAIYHYDAYTNAMIMGGRVDAFLARGPLSLYDNYFFAPIPNTIVFNENLFGLSLIFAPFYLLSDSPLFAYNATLLVSMALSVFFTYLLVRKLTGSALAGLLAGVAFSFSPYLMFELGRIQLVTTQWIPATFLMLHLAVEKQRLRYILGLWLCYLLQIGTCLYYAMFLIPLLSLVAAVLLFRHRPPRRFYLQLLAIGSVAGSIALAMVLPYFRARDTFSLERSLSFAASYDGKLSFFSNVPGTNLSLGLLHHQGAAVGAHEEMAFPGFTVLALLLLSLSLPLWQSFRSLRPQEARTLLLGWAAVASLTIGATLLTHSMLAGALVFGLGVWQQVRSGQLNPFSGSRGLHFALLLFSILLFLGLFPLEWKGEPVHGLYYYFHSYFPGFNGIRKVSRQAVMTTFAFVLLSSFGSAWLFSKLKNPWHKAGLAALLLGTTVYELRSFPHPLQEQWAGATVPEAYDFLASQAPDELVAVIPQNNGRRHFRGDRGMALHNYLALYHKHRFLNGQSSWMPPVTELVRRSLARLPNENARRVLQIVNTDHLLIHGEDLLSQRRDLPQRLAAEPQHYRHSFHEGSDHVFSLLIPKDPSLTLAAVPRLPASAQRVPPKELSAIVQLNPERADRSLDDDPRSYWTGRKEQTPGQSYELKLQEARPLIAFEIENPGHVMQLPLSYDLSFARGDSQWQTVASEPHLRLFREQVDSPKAFVFRIVLDKSILADRVRIQVVEPVPGHAFIVHEARLYFQDH